MRKKYEQQLKDLKYIAIGTMVCYILLCIVFSCVEKL